MMALDFTDRQARTIAAAITTVSGLVILVAIGLLGWLAALVLVLSSDKKLHLLEKVLTMFPMPNCSKYP